MPLSWQAASAHYPCEQPTHIGDETSLPVLVAPPPRPPPLLENKRRGRPSQFPMELSGDEVVNNSASFVNYSVFSLSAIIFI